MMPGYVFVFAHEEYESIKLRQIDHVIRVLRCEEEPEGYLMGRDRELAELFLKKDGVLGKLAAVEIDGTGTNHGWAAQELSGQGHQNGQAQTDG